MVGAQGLRVKASEKRYFFVFCSILAVVGSAFATGAWSTFRDAEAAFYSANPSSDPAVEVSASELPD